MAINLVLVFVLAMKMALLRGRLRLRLLPADQKLCLDAAGVAEYNSL